MVLGSGLLTLAGLAYQQSGSDARLIWVDEQRLIDAGATPWMEAPLWVLESDPEPGGFNAINYNKAFVAGLTFRSLAVTGRNTLAWEATRPANVKRLAGMRPRT